MAMHANTSPAAREIRVFLSSTFKDMEHERQHLMSQVFPMFRQLCLQRSVVFTEIDLRWGITQEAAHNGRTVQICLEEIERCRSLKLPPFFIGFLGERYGWIPTRADLKDYWEQNADSAYATQIEQALAQGMGVTELEIRFGFLDTMVVPDSSRVLMLLRSAQLTQDFAHSDPGMAAAGQTAQPSVLGRLRKIFSGTDTQPRDDLYHEHSQRPRLEQLKQTVRQSHQDGITSLVDGYESLDAFGRHVYDFLVQQLDTLFPAQQAPDEHHQQQLAHQAYAASRLRSHVRDPQLTRHMRQALGHGQRLVLLQGASGSGKSAFLADFARQMHEEGQAWVFRHFCVVESWASIENWRDRLLQDLRLQGLVNMELPELSQDCWAALPLWLEQVSQTTGKPVLLVVDALDQLVNAAEALELLQQVPWPAQVSLLASSTPELQAPAAWQQESMPALDADRRRYFVNAYLGQFAKEAPEDLVQAIASTPECGNPLFLKLVLEESRIRAKHETLIADVQRLLSHKEPGLLFLAMLQELDRDFGFYAEKLATRAARLMAAARQGMTHHALAEMLATARQARVPDAVLLPLLANLQAYSQQSHGRLQLIHTVLLQALEADRAGFMQTRRDLLAHHAGDEPWALAEYAYQMLRLQHMEMEDAMRHVFQGDADEALQGATQEDYFATLMRRDAQQSERLVDSLKRMQALVKIWEFDPNVVYNSLHWIGAGKPWQPTIYQEKLVHEWFKSIEHLDAATLQQLRLDDLGDWFEKRGFDFLAMAFMEKLMEFKLAEMPEAMAELARTAANLGKLKLDTGLYEPAHALLTQAQDWWKKCGMAQSRQMAITLSNLSTLGRALGQTQQALSLLLQALRIQQESEPGISLFTTYLLTNIAMLHADNEDFAQAHEVAATAYRVRVNILGPVDVDVAQALGTIAEIHALQNDLPAAADHMSQCVDMLRLCARENHPLLLKALASLAALQTDLGQLQTAAALYEEALQCCEYLYPPGNSHTIDLLQKLSLLHLQLGHADETQYSLESLLAQLYKAQKPDPQTACRAHHALAQLLESQASIEQAIAHYRQTLAFLESCEPSPKNLELRTQTQQALGRLQVPNAFALPGYQAGMPSAIRYRLGEAKQPDQAKST